MESALVRNWLFTTALEDIFVAHALTLTTIDPQSTTQEIGDVIAEDLHIASPEVHFKAFRTSLLNGSQNVICDGAHKAIRSITKHGMCLTTSCLSVDNQSTTPAIHQPHGQT